MTAPVSPSQPTTDNGLNLLWRTDNPYPDVILDSYGEGQPGASLSISSGNLGLQVAAGEVLKEISRRLSAVQTAPALRAALHEASIYGIGATSDVNQRIILEAARSVGARP